MAHEMPPPAVLRSQRNMGASNGNGATNDAFGNTDEWQPIDYWYNRVLSKSSPAANTANPSALGLIAFGYTTALLQVCAKSMLCIKVSAARKFLLVSDLDNVLFIPTLVRKRILACASCQRIMSLIVRHLRTSLKPAIDCSRSFVLSIVVLYAGSQHSVDRDFH